MLNMTGERLAEIEKRFELCTVFGSPDALTADDIRDLITEVREVHAQRAHLIALNRQNLARLGALGTSDNDTEKTS